MTAIPIIRPWIGEEEAQAARQAILSGWIAQGPKVREFEDLFQARVGAVAAVAVSSATTGLHLALLQAGVEPGDEVVCPSLSYIATANSVRYCGATPVFADVDPVTQNLTPQTVAAVLTPRTRAVLVAHQLGIPADVEAIAAVCPPSMPMVEDAACALGSTWRGRPVGAGASLAVFSFHPRKLVTTGEGGMIVASDPAAAERMRRLRQHGVSISDLARHGSKHLVLEHFDELGFNYRLTDIQAAVGIVQLGRLDAMVVRRRDLADRYRELLGHRDDLLLPGDPLDGQTNYQSYCVLLRDRHEDDRNAVLDRLLEQGIGARRGIVAAHLEPVWRDAMSVPLPETERWSRQSLVLPMYHEMTAADLERTASAFLAALDRSRA